MTSSSPIVIVGAGVLGLCTAFELHRRGRAVLVVDPGEVNASLVAAGMIAPAMESAIDDVSLDRAQLFRAGRDLWPEFASAAGIALAHRPAEWRGGDVGAMEARLRALGFDARRDGASVTTDDDYQVEPTQALAALRRALGDAVVAWTVTTIARIDGGWRLEVGDRWLDAEGVVLATGAGDAIIGLPDVARRLIEEIQPIRGQIGVAAEHLVDHVVRGPGAYVAPMASGAVIGATMEPGRRDTAPDAEASERLTQAASASLGRSPEPLTIEWRVGIRGATADGLPLAGAAPGEEGLFMTLAPRRNGWLLGPLVGAVVADAIEGRTASPHARALDPGRF
ncbi:FAD-binding oxidoreductase [uncultured Brevundimonas sp.]|uniref:NAD(P)/FAD-dependent oxidoreductase n=1 Tax=uncultured Brevundimonas sp. TaxID=213418 RepID=UPI0025D8334C|nr:FAD-dependent oxidoreductase [uncultured Brevundimonas sp.]